LLENICYAWAWRKEGGQIGGKTRDSMGDMKALIVSRNLRSTSYVGEKKGETRKRPHVATGKKEAAKGRPISNTRDRNLLPAGGLKGGTEGRKKAFRQRRTSATEKGAIFHKLPQEK